jgi:hypothetical protein
MTPNEVAMKFSSASGTCRNGRCPYTSECRGTSDTCKLKEVALMIRSLVADLSMLQSRYTLLESTLNANLEYIRDLEKINRYYTTLCSRFQEGYRPKAKVVKKAQRLRQKKKPKEPELMDGDEQFAYKDPNKKLDLPVVII